MFKNAESHLRMAVDATAATWAAVVGWKRGRWVTHAAVGLPKARFPLLAEQLGRSQAHRLLIRPVARPLKRPSKIGKISGLGASSLDVYPLGGEAAILVAARTQSKSQKQVWRLTADAITQAQPGRSEPRARVAVGSQDRGLLADAVHSLVGLTDPSAVANVAAEVLFKHYPNGRATVALSDGDAGSPLVGVAGTKDDVLARQRPDSARLLQEGVTGQVFATGKSVLIHGASGKRSATGSKPDGLSEFCVPLKQGAHVLGVVDVTSSQPRAFADSDVLAIEALAGVASAVLWSGSQYGRLSESIRDLRAAQVEAASRLAAQLDAESRLVQAAKLAAVGEMAAGIAHELNNPLTTVTGFAELLLDETPAEAPYRADLEMVMQEAMRARDVVRRLLDFARQGEKIKARLDVNEILDDVLALTRHFLHTSGVLLTRTGEPDLPWVTVDPNQMKQVFLNLIHNALQAMPVGGQLDLRTSARLRDDRNWVVVSVADSGTGIDPKDIDRIFEPFFTTRGGRGGTGLGLSVTYGIVMDHGGTIEVESQPGQGSTFSVWLPT